MDGCVVAGCCRYAVNALSGMKCCDPVAWFWKVLSRICIFGHRICSSCGRVLAFCALLFPRSCNPWEHSRRYDRCWDERCRVPSTANTGILSLTAPSASHTTSLDTLGQSPFRQLSSPVEQCAQRQSISGSPSPLPLELLCLLSGRYMRATIPNETPTTRLIFWLLHFMSFLPPVLPIPHFYYHGGEPRSELAATGLPSEETSAQRTPKAHYHPQGTGL